MSRYMPSLFGGGRQSEPNPYEDQRSVEDDRRSRTESSREASEYRPDSRRGTSRGGGREYTDGRRSPTSARGYSSAGPRTNRGAYTETGFTEGRPFSERGYSSVGGAPGPYSEKDTYFRREQAGNSPGYLGSFAPNPSFIRFLRFLLYCLSSGAALATAGLAISVVAYYNANAPSIKPSWGSLIALIVFGLITPGALFGTFLITPRLFKYGTVLGIVNQVRIDLLLQFALAGIWVSGALAMASDLRGYENCIWDGYYYFPKPDDFNHVCDLINATVNMGYATFGVIALQWFLLTTIAIYILLYLDQEVLSELTNDMGGRAYRARTAALAAAGRASRPETEFGRGAYSGPSEKAGPGYMSPSQANSARIPPSASMGRRMSRDYSEAEGGRPYAYSGTNSRRGGGERDTEDGRSDDLEGRGSPTAEGDDEVYYGYDDAERRGTFGGRGRRNGSPGPMMHQSERRDGPWSEDMRDL